MGSAVKHQTVSYLTTSKNQGLKKIFPGKPRIAVGFASCGIAAGADKVMRALEQEIKRRRLDVMLTKVGCIGYCTREPLVNVSIPGLPLVIYQHMTPEDVVPLLDAVISNKVYTYKVLCRIEQWDHITKGNVLHYGSGWPDVPRYAEVPFFSKQQKIILRNTGLINPEDIDEYIAVGGFSALHKALTTMTPEQVIDEVAAAGLRGRGGAGFPTAQKWRLARKAPGDTKYIICNADEGDPGAYMNRNEMESDPCMLLEGMIIGAYAIGAQQGIIYIREEYPLAIKRLQHAIAQVRACGFLGRNILGSGFSFDIAMVKGAGAFVCGEETALIASIEGFAGRSRPRPPFPAEKGLWGKPTNINNVETWCNIPVIVSRGGAWFSRIGTENSKGTKVLSLVGKISQAGLAEIPFGTTLKTLVYDIGGGGADGKRIKAVQTGGPSGGCIPSAYFDSPIDYESLTSLGSIMGSGGVVVVDEDTCMVDTARYFVDFTKSESCGKCTPCREGLKHMLGLLTNICNGNGNMEDLGVLEDLAQLVKKASLCGLGQSAPNPVVTTLKYFRHEYENHIKARRCHAGACAQLFVAPCENACPIHMNIPGYLTLLKEGRLAEAYAFLLQDNPLPATTGRVCHHPCQSRCRRCEVDGTVSTREIHRFIADAMLENKKELRRVSPKRLKPTGKKIAIVGAGPAGLTAAYYLAKFGHHVTVYDAYPRAGGMLTYGIPEFRLPKKIVEQEVSIIQKLGVRFIFNTKIGKDKSIAALRRENDAVFLAIGAHRESPLRIQGEDADGVLSGVEFLRDFNFGKQVALGAQTVVIGGGNVAMDAARVAKRLGSEVTILYRREKSDMPADEEEITQAEEEGIPIMTLVAPQRILVSNGRVKGITLVCMRPGDYDTAGRRVPTATEQTITLECDTVIAAIGQVCDSDFIGRSGIALHRNGTVQVDPFTLATNVPGVYAGGDVVTGPLTVSEAMGQGKQFARELDKRLMGEDRFSSLFKKITYSNDVAVEPQGGPRNLMPTVAGDIRRHTFDEVTLRYDPAVAQREVTRCLRCDVKE